MLGEDQYMEHTPDLVAKIRKMREIAEKEMNRFTRAADYDVRRVVGQKPKELIPANQEPVITPAKLPKSPTRPASNQAVIEFPPATSDPDEEGA